MKIFQPIVTGSLTVITGSSIEFQVTNTGAKIGSAITDTHPITGSVNISGSITTIGNINGATPAEVGYLSGVTSNIQTQIGNVRDQSISVYQALGSSVKAQTVGLNILGITQVGVAMQGAGAGSQIRLIPIYIETPQTIYGVMWYQGSATGVYTPNNENRTGLYSYTPVTGIATLAGSGVNNGNLWSASYTSTNTFTSQSFSSPVTNAQGFYYIALLMSFSAATTAPTFGAGPNLGAATVRTMDFTSGSFIMAVRTTVSALPGTITVNTYNSTNQGNIWAAVY